MFSMIVIILMLLVCSAFFSGSETALFSLSGVMLHRFRESRSASASRLVSYLKEPRKLLVTILLGNELVNVSISIVGAAIVSRILKAGVEVQTIAAVVLLTPVILIVGEIVPKNISLHYAWQIAPVVIWPLGLFYKTVRPLRVVLTKFADFVVHLLGGEPKRLEPMIMEEEFRRLIDLGREKGMIVEEERELIHNVFDFTDKVAGDIMTEAQSVFSLSIDVPYERLIEDIRSVQFSRIPFYEGEKSNIIGILHVRDLFSFHRRRLSGKTEDIRGILHEPLFVDAATPLEVLLKEFQRTQIHMAIVRGEGNKLEGIVTMGDVLEELFGAME